jgi:hypothetical protein
MAPTLCTPLKPSLLLLQRRPHRAQHQQLPPLPLLALLLQLRLLLPPLLLQLLRLPHRPALLPSSNQRLNLPSLPMMDRSAKSRPVWSSAE